MNSLQWANITFVYFKYVTFVYVKYINIIKANKTILTWDSTNVAGMSPRPLLHGGVTILKFPSLQLLGGPPRVDDFSQYEPSGASVSQPALGPPQSAFPVMALPAVSPERAAALDAGLPHATLTAALCRIVFN